MIKALVNYQISSEPQIMRLELILLAGKSK
jgi:hypothetical protein